MRNLVPQLDSHSVIRWTPASGLPGKRTLSAHLFSDAFTSVTAWCVYFIRH